MFVYKEVKIRDLPKIFKKTVATNGTILILVACATGFGRVLTMEQIPNSVAMAITSVTSNKVLLLILINILLLVEMCIRDRLSLIRAIREFTYLHMMSRGAWQDKREKLWQSLFLR